MVEHFDKNKAKTFRKIVDPTGTRFTRHEYFDDNNMTLNYRDEDGLLHGLYIGQKMNKYNEYGVAYSNYVHGKKHGEQYYIDEGKLYSVERYNHGFKEGKQEWGLNLPDLSRNIVYYSNNEKDETIHVIEKG